MHCTFACFCRITPTATISTYNKELLQGTHRECRPPQLLNLLGHLVSSCLVLHPGFLYSLHTAQHSTAGAIGDAVDDGLHSTAQRSTAQQGQLL
jgi:hypothetical protein